jgi:hypothetical protein
MVDIANLQFAQNRHHAGAETVYERINCFLLGNYGAENGGKGDDY